MPASNDSGRGSDTPNRATCTVDEAAEILGVARHTAYQAVKRGEIPTIRVGRRLLVSRRRLEQMLDGDAREEVSA
jgi:excisionase family DNA binding protein